MGTYALVGTALTLQAKVRRCSGVPPSCAAAVQGRPCLALPPAACPQPPLAPPPPHPERRPPPPCTPQVFVLGLLGPARAPAALIAAHAASRWTCLPLTYRCEYVQDPEDAKRGLYNVFAASRPLLTLPRILLGTASAAAALWLALPFEQAAAAALVVIAVTAASGYYGAQL